MSLWPPWQYTGDDWSGIQTLVLLLAGGIAWWQASEARKLRLERSRPFVILDLEVHQTIAEFRITNIGATLARNIRFEFDPPLKSTRDDHPGSTSLADLNLFAKGIPSLPPGKEIVLIFDQLPTRMEEGRDLPDDYEVTISYEDTLGRKHSETMTVGYSHRRNMVYRTRYGLSDIHKRLEEIAREMKRWTVRGSAIKVMTPSEIRREDRRTEEYYARMEAEQKRQDGTEEPNGDAPHEDASSVEDSS